MQKHGSAGLSSTVQLSLVSRQQVQDPDMRFRNVKTGAVIEAPSMLGGPWERIDGGKAPEKEPVVVPEPAVEKEVKPVKKTRRTTKSKK